MKKTVNIFLSVILCIAVSVLTITFSIGLPIYLRPFYYMQIEELSLPEETGHSYESIKAAYDELLDYLTLPGREFGTGEFAFSEAGQNHFVECKALFDLNIISFVISVAAILIIAVLAKKKVITLYRVRGYGLSFVSGVLTLSLFSFLGLIIAAGFNRAFFIFHGIFFPDNYDWILDPTTDEIILALPITFFMRCAVLIGVSIILISSALVVFGAVRHGKNKSKNY